MKTVPVSALPAQSFSVVLGEQACAIRLTQKTTGLFMDLSVAGTEVVTGAICRDMVGVVRQAYLGFKGDLVFMDTQGSADPEYTGLGTRFVLMYLETSDT